MDSNKPTTYQSTLFREKAKRNLFASSGPQGLFKMQPAIIDDFDREPFNEYGSSSHGNNSTNTQDSSQGAISWSRQS